MTDKELRRLGRTALLEMLIDMGKQNEALQEENEALKKQQEEKEICIENAGSIAKAALELNKIFEDAQEAADQYLLNVQRLQERQTQRFDEVEEHVKVITKEKIDEAEQTLETAKQEAEQTLTSAREEAEQTVTSAREEAEQTLTSAREEAEQTVTSAREEAEQTVTSAKEEAEQILTSAREEAKQTLTSAREEAEQILIKAKQQIDSYFANIDNLKENIHSVVLDE